MTEGPRTRPAGLASRTGCARKKRSQAPRFPSARVLPDRLKIETNPRSPTWHHRASIRFTPPLPSKSAATATGSTAWTPWRRRPRCRWTGFRSRSRSCWRTCSGARTTGTCRRTTSGRWRAGTRRRSRRRRSRSCRRASCCRTSPGFPRWWTWRPCATASGGWEATRNASTRSSPWTWSSTTPCRWTTSARCRRSPPIPRSSTSATRSGTRSCAGARRPSTTSAWCRPTRASSTR